MMLNNQRFNALKLRIAKLVINGKMDKEHEKSIILHIEASLEFGEAELIQYSELSDEDLSK